MVPDSWQSAEFGVSHASVKSARWREEVEQNSKRNVGMEPTTITKLLQVSGVVVDSIK
jgi:hypothetical protein